MEILKTFLDQCVMFEIFETEVKGLYELNAGLTKNGKEVDLSADAFDDYFEDSDHFADNYVDYSFKSIEEFKMAAISSLYFIALINAQKILIQYIITRYRNTCPIAKINPKSHIYEGPATDNPKKWSIFIDVRDLV